MWPLFRTLHDGKAELTIKLFRASHETADFLSEELFVPRRDEAHERMRGVIPCAHIAPGTARTSGFLHRMGVMLRMLHSIEVRHVRHADNTPVLAEGGGLSDRMEQPLRVVPAGFPRSWSASGTHKGKQSLSFALDKDVVPHSLRAEVAWHPSSVSSLIGGMEGMIRSPGGCFEQTSSTNWPNVAILNYLEAHDGDPRLRAKSSKSC